MVSHSNDFSIVVTRIYLFLSDSSLQDDNISLFSEKNKKEFPQLTVNSSCETNFLYSSDSKL